MTSLVHTQWDIVAAYFGLVVPFGTFGVTLLLLRWASR